MRPLKIRVLVLDFSRKQRSKSSRSRASDRCPSGPHQPKWSSRLRSPAGEVQFQGLRCSVTITFDPLRNLMGEAAAARNDTVSTVLRILRSESDTGGGERRSSYSRSCAIDRAQRDRERVTLIADVTISNARPTHSCPVTFCTSCRRRQPG